MFILIVRILLTYLIISLFFGLVINWGINEALKKEEQNNLIMWFLIIFDSLLWPYIILRYIKNRKNKRYTMDELRDRLIEFQQECINSTEEDP